MYEEALAHGLLTADDEEDPKQQLGQQTGKKKQDKIYTPAIKVKKRLTSKMSLLYYKGIVRKGEQVCLLSFSNYSYSWYVCSSPRCVAICY